MRGVRGVRGGRKGESFDKNCNENDKSNDKTSGRKIACIERVKPLSLLQPADQLNKTHLLNYLCSSQSSS